MAVSLKNKIVLITGASSGIGEGSAILCAEQGAKLIITARRKDKLDQLASRLKKEYKTDVLPLQLDVRDKNQIDSCLKNLPDEWKKIDVLLNNAGLALATDPIQSGNAENWDTMIDTNIKGLLYMTRAILPLMLARNSGHVINIGSIAGRECYPGGNVYAATKHAVKAISQSLRIDLLGKQIRVSEIAPGAVNTEFSTVRWKDKAKADVFYQEFEPLLAEDIADAVVYCATRPLHVNVSEMVVYPTVQASCNHLARDGADAGRGLLD